MSNAIRFGGRFAIDFAIRNYRQAPANRTRFSRKSAIHKSSRLDLSHLQFQALTNPSVPEGCEDCLKKREKTVTKDSAKSHTQSGRLTVTFDLHERNWFGQQF